MFQLSKKLYLKKQKKTCKGLSLYRRRHLLPMTCGFAVFVAAAAVAVVELAVVAAADAGLSVAFQSEPPFLPRLSGCIGPPA